MSAPSDTTAQPNPRSADTAIQRAAHALGALDEALDSHPLLPAFLYRIRLETAQAQAAVDGHAVDHWHLAASLCGLPIRMTGLDAYERGNIVDAARAALTHHQWMNSPDFDQEGDIQDAERHLAEAVATGSLAAVAERAWTWLDSGRARPPLRAALARSWKPLRLLRAPVPLSGPRAMSPDAPAERKEWTASLCRALADEAANAREILRRLDREWLSARQRAGGRRSTSRAGTIIDVLAAVPVVSATSIAAMTGLSIKTTLQTLERFENDGIVVEITHRSAHRLFAMSNLAPLRAATREPKRPEPGRRRGRPPLVSNPDTQADDDAPEPAEDAPPPVARPLPAERPKIDYSDLEAALAACDQVIRTSKGNLDALQRRINTPDAA